MVRSNSSWEVDIRRRVPWKRINKDAISANCNGCVWFAIFPREQGDESKPLSAGEIGQWITDTNRIRLTVWVEAIGGSVEVVVHAVVTIFGRDEEGEAEGTSTEVSNASAADPNLQSNPLDRDQIYQRGSPQASWSITRTSKLGQR